MRIILRRQEDSGRRAQTTPRRLGKFKKLWGTLAPLCLVALLVFLVQSARASIVDKDVSSLEAFEGTVISNQYVASQGYATWSLVVGSGERFLLAAAHGTNTGPLKEAAIQAERAKATGESVKVTGRLGSDGVLSVHEWESRDEDGRQLLIRIGTVGAAQPTQGALEPITFLDTKPWLITRYPGQMVRLTAVPLKLTRFEHNGEYGYLNMVVGDEEQALTAYESGYNVAVLSQVSALAEAARETGSLVELVGRYDAEEGIFNLKRFGAAGYFFDTDAGDSTVDVGDTVEEETWKVGKEVRVTREVPVYVTREVPVYVYEPYPYWWYRPYYVHWDVYVFFGHIAFRHHHGWYYPRWFLIWEPPLLWWDFGYHHVHHYHYHHYHHHHVWRHYPDCVGRGVADRPADPPAYAPGTAGAPEIPLAHRERANENWQFARERAKLGELREATLTRIRERLENRVSYGQDEAAESSRAITGPGTGKPRAGSVVTARSWAERFEGMRVERRSKLGDRLKPDQAEPDATRPEPKEAAGEPTREKRIDDPFGKPTKGPIAGFLRENRKEGEEGSLTRIDRTRPGNNEAGGRAWEKLKEIQQGKSGASHQRAGIVNAPVTRHERNAGPDEEVLRPTVKEEDAKVGRQERSGWERLREVQEKLRERSRWGAQEEAQPQRESDNQIRGKMSGPEAESGMPHGRDALPETLREKSGPGTRKDLPREARDEVQSQLDTKAGETRGKQWAFLRQGIADRSGRALTHGDESEARREVSITPVPSRESEATFVKPPELKLFPGHITGKQGDTVVKDRSRESHEARAPQGYSLPKSPTLVSKQRPDLMGSGKRGETAGLIRVPASGGGDAQLGRSWERGSRSLPGWKDLVVEERGLGESVAGGFKGAKQR